MRRRALIVGILGLTVVLLGFSLFPQEKSVQAHLISGLTYEALGLPQMALNELAEAFRMDNYNEEVRSSLALFLQVYANISDSLPFWESLGSGEPWRLVMQAQAQARSGRTERAEALYRRALEQDGELVLGLYGLAEVLTHKDREDEALGLLSQAVELRPDHLPSLKLQGLILLGREDFEGAEDAFRESLAWDNGQAEIHYYLGRTLQAQGRTPEAHAQYLRATEFDKTFMPAWNALEEISD